MSGCKYSYGDDFPVGLTDFFKILQQPAEPFHTDGSPLAMLKQLEAIANFKPPERKAGGIRNPAAAQKAALKAMLQPTDGTIEKDGEASQRGEAQLVCRRAIPPKSAKEEKTAVECFLKRLATHREVPDAMILPMQPAEDGPAFYARLKAATKHERALMLPRIASETPTQFEMRLACAVKSASPLVLPRGASESPQDFEQRLKAQSGASVPIMARTAGEPPAGFATRCRLQQATKVVVHAFDATRESVSAYEARLALQAKAGGHGAEALEPGSVKEGAAAAAAAREEDESPEALAAEVAAKTKEKEEKAKAAAEAAQKEAAVRRLEDAADAAELEAALEEASNLQLVNAAVLDAAALRLEGLKHAAAPPTPPPPAAPPPQPEPTPPVGPVQVDLNSMGFKALKDMLIERGVPEAAVKSAPTKFALREVAQKHPECGIEFA